MSDPDWLTRGSVTHTKREKNASADGRTRIMDAFTAGAHDFAMENRECPYESGSELAEAWRGGFYYAKAYHDRNLELIMRAAQKARDAEKSEAKLERQRTKLTEDETKRRLISELAARTQRAEPLPENFRPQKTRSIAA